MGIVIKQSLRNMITTYAGFAIGALNTLFLFTYFLTKEYYGLVSYILSVSNLIWPFLVFGVHSTLIKFFSSYKTRSEQNRLLNFVLIAPAVSGLLIGIFGFLMYEQLLNYFSGENDLVQPYIWLIFIVALSTAYFEVFFAWSMVYYKSVFGNAMKEVFQRLGVTILLLAYYFDLVAIDVFIYGVASVYVIRTLVMAAYAFSLHKPEFRFRFPKNLRSILKYSALILMAASVATLLLDLDKAMIEYYLPIENVAIYSIAVYIATVVVVPQKAMHQITNPLTAEYLNKKDKSSLADLYRKSSVNLLTISGLIFILIVTNVHALYEMIPKEYTLSILIVILLCTIKLYDSFLGNNNSILFNSDYYRLVLGIGILIVISAFLLNVLFIPLYGIEGAAIASFIAFFAYNSSKIYLVFRKFRIHPISGKSLMVVGLILIFTIVFYLVEFPFHAIIQIGLKSIITIIAYVFIVYKLNISEELTAMANRFLR